MDDIRRLEEQTKVELDRVCLVSFRLLILSANHSWVVKRCVFISLRSLATKGGSTSGYHRHQLKRPRMLLVHPCRRHRIVHDTLRRRCGVTADPLFVSSVCTPALVNQWLLLSTIYVCLSVSHLFPVLNSPAPSRPRNPFGGFVCLSTDDVYSRVYSIERCKGTVRSICVYGGISTERLIDIYPTANSTAGAHYHYIRIIKLIDRVLSHYQKRVMPKYCIHRFKKYRSPNRKAEKNAFVEGSSVVNAVIAADVSTPVPPNRRFRNRTERRPEPSRRAGPRRPLAVESSWSRRQMSGPH